MGAIDLTQLEKLAKGNISFLTHFLSKFQEKVPLEVSELTEALRLEDGKSALYLSHKLKSSFQIIGAKQLAELLAKLESSLRTESGNKIDEELVLQIETLSANSLAEMQKIQQSLL